MSAHHTRTDHDLDRTGRRLRGSGRPFLLIGVLLGAAGILLIVLGDHWVRGAGFALAALAVPPATIGIALLASGFVSWWAARQKPFA
jgi:hypothetical protein